MSKKFINTELFISRERTEDNYIEKISASPKEGYSSYSNNYNNLSSSYEAEMHFFPSKSLANNCNMHDSKCNGSYSSYSLNKLNKLNHDYLKNK